MTNIRVGLIRCDTHGMYYGPLMAEHDPMMLQRPMAPVQHPKPTLSLAEQEAFYEKQGYHYSWQSGGVHMYFYNRYGYPLEMTAPFVGGFEVVKLWDKHREAAEQAARVFFGKPKVCDTFEEVSDEVDLVFIADCNGDGSDHLKLATPGLKKGVATFIDKPLAFTHADARKLLALSKRHRAPMFSCSILRALPQVAQFAASVPQTGGVHAGIVEGGGTHLAGQIHAISLAQAVFGNGIESVRAMGATGAEIVHLAYGARRDRPRHGVVLHSHLGPMFHATFHVSAYGPDCAVHAPSIINDFFFPQGAARILELCRTMVRTGRVPPLMNDMVEAVAVAEAARRSFKTGRAGQVESVGQRNL